MLITRRHCIASAHRLYQYGGRCERLHGHNYRIELSLSAEELDEEGMVADFGEVKRLLCGELDEAWDHRTLLYDQDPLCAQLRDVLPDGSLCPVPFNPTAENMAAHLGRVLFPKALERAGLAGRVRVAQVTVYETDNNSATWSAR